MSNDDTAGRYDTSTSTTSMVPSAAMSNAVGAERRPGVNVSHTTAPSSNASASGYALHTVVVNQLELVPEIGTHQELPHDDRRRHAEDAPVEEAFSQVLARSRAGHRDDARGQATDTPTRYRTSAIDTSGSSAPTNV